MKRQRTPSLSQQQEHEQQQDKEQRTMSTSKTEKTEQQLTEEEQYFADYGTVETHELMLKDTVRTEMYLKAIQSNPGHFENKVVLDVGCGTGILSMFAVKFGNAKKVYAVEASAMSATAKVLIEQNGMSDRITVIHDLIENVQLPEKVDVIISEWMGFYLVHESMLDSVLVARDKWLKSDGVMYPSSAHIYASPCNMSALFEQKVNYWGDVYGLDFSPIAPYATEKLLSKPYIDHLEAEQLLSDRVLLKKIDIKTVTIAELHSIRSQATFTIKKSGILQGFCIWFDVVFEGSEETVVLDTAPGIPSTHWKQTVLLLPEHFEISEGLELPAVFSIESDSHNHRHYHLSVELGDGSAEDEEAADGEEDDDEECEPDCECIKCKLIRALTEKYNSEEYKQQRTAEE